MDLPEELADRDRFSKLPAPVAAPPAPAAGTDAEAMRPTWELICASLRKAYHYA